VIDVQGISDSFPLASRIGLSFDFALFVYMLGAANTPLELDYFVEETIAKRLKTGARREKYFRVSENFNRRKKKITKITKKKKTITKTSTLKSSPRITKSGKGNQIILRGECPISKDKDIALKCLA